MDQFSDPSPIATTEQFKAALLAVRDRFGIAPKDLQLLRAHCRAPRHTITAGQLAQELGAASYSAANLHYGTFAHQVADTLHYRPGPFSDGKPHWWRTLAFGSEDGQPTDDGYEWIMRPELFQALQELRWA